MVDGGGTGGNPDLKPIRSTNLDAGLEWYFAKRSLLSERYPGTLAEKVPSEQDIFGVFFERFFDITSSGVEA